MSLLLVPVHARIKAKYFCLHYKHSLILQGATQCQKTDHRGHSEIMESATCLYKKLHSNHRNDSWLYITVILTKREEF